MICDFRESSESFPLYWLDGLQRFSDLKRKKNSLNLTMFNRIRAKSSCNKVKKQTPRNTIYGVNWLLLNCMNWSFCRRILCICLLYFSAFKVTSILKYYFRLYISLQIGLDGIRILDPATNRTLKVYSLETVTKWEVSMLHIIREAIFTC